MMRRFSVVALFAAALLILGSAQVARCDGHAPVPGRSARERDARKRSAPAKRDADRKTEQVQRFGRVVGLNRETKDQYVILHAHVWPEVLKQIRDSNIRNYSIFMGELDDGQLYLFSYFEYVGDDFDTDMQAMANDPVTREWWKLTDPLQKRVKDTPTGEQWKPFEKVFHTD